MQLCDKALTSCDRALQAEKALAEKQKNLVQSKQQEINDLKDQSEVFYRKPLPWLIVGGIVTLLNPLIGAPLVAAGIARAL